jgi:hypothetical protein
MAMINYEILSEIIFMNDTIFTDIDINKAKIIARTCKIAKSNKNIKLSFDICKINIYFNRIINTSKKKTEKEFDEKPLIERMRGNKLNINKKYKAKIYNIISHLLCEDANIIDGVKNKLVTEQRSNIDKYITKLNTMILIINNIVDDTNNITDDERELVNEDDDYRDQQYDIAELISIFKYNSYFINMFSKTLVNEKDVIGFISSKYYTKNWYKIPIVFTKKLLEKISSRHTNIN